MMNIAFTILSDHILTKCLGNGIPLGCMFIDKYIHNICKARCVSLKPSRQSSAKIVSKNLLFRLL